MSTQTRRAFFRTAAATAAVGLTSGVAGRASAASGREAPRVPFDLGIASYTFRSFSVDEAIRMTARLRVKKLTLKDMHLPMAVTAPEMAAVREKLTAAGIELASCGVIYMQTEDAVHKAFAYAQLAGISMMVGVPHASLLALTERKVKETGIAVAIHNHGPNDERYPSPESAYRAVEKMDRRLGLCIDVGHTQRLGLDPAAEAERFFDRLLDVHMKDVSAPSAEGATVEVGSGVIDVPKLLKTLVRLGYSRTVHFEHEKDAKDPFPGLAESVGYVRGVVAAL